MTTLKPWLAAVAIWLNLQVPAYALGLIRDAEIESILDELAAPIFEAAGLDPDTVQIYLVNDSRLNAFVAGGQNLFINTGLLQRAEGLHQIAGVIAHETGHIAGGHLTRLSQASDTASAEALIGAVLGAAAALAGAPQLGTAIIAGGATIAERGFLRFNRGQEQAADQAAIGYLERSRISPRGLMEFFRILENRNLRISSDGSEFLRTHPLTRDRIAFLEAQIAQSPIGDLPESDESLLAHARIEAKLDGFLGERGDVLRKWRGDSMPDRYARAIADYREGRIDSALSEVASLIDEAQADPYLHELQGQILFESGRIDQSIAPYRKALEQLPASALMRLGLARALIERAAPGDLEESASLLREAAGVEPRNATVHRFLGIALGRSGQHLKADLSLAEAAVLRGDKDDADLYLRRARKGVISGDVDWLKLQDLTRARNRLD